MELNTRGPAFIALIILYLFLVSCGKDNVTLDGFTHTISGTVYDSVTGLTLDSALVTWGDTVNVSAVVTDSSGTYQFELPVGSATIFVRRQNYNTKSRFLADIRSDISGIDLSLVQAP